MEETETGDEEGEIAETFEESAEETAEASGAQNSTAIGEDAATPSDDALLDEDLENDVSHKGLRNMPFLYVRNVLATWYF